jgi:Zn-dependent protease
VFQNFDIVSILIKLPGILIGFTFHEYAHAYFATKYGDPTPGAQGRLTVNPLAHIDIWGLLMVLFVGFGWAKPVQTDPSRYSGNVRKKDMIVSFAGPATNFVIALFTAIIIKVLLAAGLFSNMSHNNAKILGAMLTYIVLVNCMLFVLNIFPIPPLDGFHIVANLLPTSSYKFVYFMEKWGSIILFVFILSPLSDYIIGRGTSYVYGFIQMITGII